MVDCSALAADIATVLDEPWGVWDLGAGAWVFESPGFVQPPLDDDLIGEGVLIALGGSWSAVAATSVDPAQDLVLVADILQDIVMDELGAGWPEQYADGAFQGLLSPKLDQDGSPWWMLRGMPFCRIGELQR